MPIDRHAHRRWQHFRNNPQMVSAVRHTEPGAPPELYRPVPHPVVDEIDFSIAQRKGRLLTAYAESHGAAIRSFPFAQGIECLFVHVTHIKFRDLLAGGEQ
jgi:hypothetical protein